MKYHLPPFNLMVSFLLFIQKRPAQLIKFLKCITIPLFFICIYTGSFSQSQGIKWQHPLGGTTGESVVATLATTDGNFLTVCETFSNNGDVTGAHGLIDVWVCKIATDGRILWSRAFGSSDQDYFLNVHNSPDGGYVLLIRPLANDGDIVGYKGLTDVFVIKLSSDGIIEWKRCIGGSSSDNYVSSFVQPDGSTFIFGNTFSNDGDFIGNHGSSDLFFCKLDSQGNLVVAKSYGGIDSDLFASVIVKSNGNLLMLGRTLSSNSGQIGANHGGTDIVLMEVSANGTFLWSKTYGGSSGESTNSFIQAGTNRFILLSQTNSSDGDMVGAHGGYDLWVGVVDSTGTIISEQMLGGSSNELLGKIFSSAVDSSIIVSCSTNSNDGDIIGYHGGSDIWMVKINNQGIVQWKKDLGGSGNEALINCQLSGMNTFFLARTSSNDGDVSGNHGKIDFWAGLIDGTGNLSWQKCLGGTEDDLGKVILLDSNQITVAGDINSSDGDVTGMHPRIDSLVGDTSTTILYHPDVWVASLSLSGTLNWQKALGGFSLEQLQSLSAIGNDLYVNALAQSNDGDVFQNHGSYDDWFVRLGPSNSITGKVFLDKNLNGIMDSGEPYVNDVIILSDKSGYNRSSIPYNGWFKNEVDTGTYTTSVHFNFPYYTSVPASVISSFSTYFNTDSISFALQPIPNKKDLVISAIPLAGARPGFNTSYKLFYKNVGTTTIPAGEILFILDSRLTFLSSVPAISSSNGDTLKWSYTNLAPADTASIILQFNVQSPPAVNIGDTLNSIAIIKPVSGDETPSDDTSFIRHIVGNSSDPNNKYENNSGTISRQNVIDGDYLNYTIRFQNTGNNTAYTVIVRDTLDSKLDVSSLQMISSSHSYDLSITDGNKLTWTFYYINLPDSNVNEPASHGYISYRIKPNNNLVAGDSIPNTASIYFDFNLPVPTNNAFTIVQNNSTLPLHLLNFSGVYRAGDAILNWSTVNEFDFEKFEIERSTNGTNFNSVGLKYANGNVNISNYQFKDDLSASGGNIFYYRLKMIDRDGRFTYSQVLLIRKDNRAINGIRVTPNPVINGQALVMMSSNADNIIQLNVFDNAGRIVLKQRNNIFQGNNSIVIDNLNLLGAGVYTIQIVNGKDRFSSKFELLK